MRRRTVKCRFGIKTAQKSAVNVDFIHRRDPSILSKD